MRKFVRFVDRLSLVGAYLSGLFVVATVGLIVLEIILRSVFDTSTHVSSEYSGYFMVAIVFLGLGYTLRDNAHIRVGMLVSRLSGKPERFLFVLVSVIAFSICTFALYYSVLMVYSSYTLGIRADTVSETPIYIPQLVIPISLFIFDLQIIAQVIKRFL